MSGKHGGESHGLWSQARARAFDGDHFVTIIAPCSFLRCHVGALKSRDGRGSWDVESKVVKSATLIGLRVE
jgi:hypothetical protein